MRSVTILAAAFAFGAGMLAMSRDAHALGPIGVEVGAKVGAASNPASSQDGVTPPNALGFGIGGRAGVTFLGIYGGVNVMYYLGSSQNASGDGASGSLKEHALLYGIEGGYGFSLSILTIRPQIGIGNGSFSFTESGAAGDFNVNGSDSKSYLYIEPGVTGLVGLGLWFVGADANVLFFPGLDNSKASFTFHGQVGLQF